MKRLNCYPVVTLIIWLIFSSLLSAAYLRNIPRKLRQPDGTVLRCYASGDEFYHWLHDENNLTIIKDPATGFYVYADLEQDRLVPSKYIAGKVSPGSLEIQPGLNIPYSIVQQRRDEYLRLLNINDAYKAPTSGELNNIVVFIRFADQLQFDHPLSEYGERFNTGTPSLWQYYAEASYSQLAIQSHFYPDSSGATLPVSYQDSHDRGYYEAYDAITNLDGYPVDENGDPADDEARIREHTLLKNAVAAVDSQVSDAGITIDSDGDGLVDNVCFIIRGSQEGWSDLLWPHMWVLWSFDPVHGDGSGNATINGKIVWTYNFNIDDFDGSAGSGVGVLAHEMFHTLGAPDLYHYSLDDLEPVGSWDLMEHSGDPPHHMGAYMKYRYGGWILTIPEISSKGIYSLAPLTSSENNWYKIASPYSTSEYFVVEYRRQEGTYESTIPGTGLLVYRINSILDGEGNADGPPDEVYLFRPGGTPSINGFPELAHFSIDYGRSEFDSLSNPQPFLSDGSPGGISISNIGSAGTTIQFEIGNFPPVGFAIVSPVGGSEVSTLTPKLTWRSAKDYDPEDTVKYEISLDTPDTGVETIPVGTDTAYTISTPLQDNIPYYWKVVASDLAGATTESIGGYQRFAVNLNNEPPLRASTITPPDSSIEITLTPNFYWTEASDPDPDDLISYSLFYWLENSGTASTLELDTNSITITNALLDNSQYSWAVKSLDNHGEYSISDTSVFWTDVFPEPPGAFLALYPENESQGHGIEVTFIWQEAADPDPLDQVSYSLIYATEWSDSSTHIRIDGITDTSVSAVLENNKEYFWLLEASDFDSLITQSNNGEPMRLVVGTLDTYTSDMIPTDYALHQNHPNPFNPSTTIRFDVPAATDIRIVMYDLLGREVVRMVDGRLEPGYHSVVWNGRDWTGRDVPTGIYITRLVTPEYAKSIKMVLLK